MSTPAPPPRARQGRAIANDVRILDAAEAVLANDGWEDASVLRVAERAGLSRRAVLSRYGDRAGVTAAVWTSHLADPLRDALGAVVAARATSDASQLASALDPFLDPSPAMRAASEVLIVSSFQTDVQAAVQSTLTAPLESWLTPQRGGLTRADAARNGAVIALALGVLVEVRSYSSGIDDMDITAGLAHFSAALAQDVPPRRLPADRATYLEGDSVPHPDPITAALLSATLRMVGSDGYEAATIDRIAAACGRTSGFIFGQYPNKRELYLDASARMLPQAEEASERFMASISRKHSPGIAYAVLTREVMRPDLRWARTNTLEQYRLSWHDAGFLDAFTRVRAQSVERVRISAEVPIEQARGNSFLDLARGIGTALLAQLHQEAGELPHDVVTVPLIDQMA